jgi:four helix bundle protein
MKIERFEDIEAWRIARELTSNVYAATKLPGYAKDFGLLDQIRRASGSIMHNIAEGFDAGSNTEFIRFLNYAKRSRTEVQSQLHVALDQAYINEAGFERLYEQARFARAKIGAFICYLEQSREHSQTLSRKPRTLNHKLPSLNPEP